MSEEADLDDEGASGNPVLLPEGTDNDPVDWKSQYQSLESSLERFKSQTVTIRQALAEKMQTLQEKTSVADSRAESAEQQLKLMEQRLAAMNWEPTEMEKQLHKLQLCCQEQDEKIKQLEQQIDEQKTLRHQDAQLVEQKATRIKEWVSRKLQTLEQGNCDLQADNELLQDQVYLLRDRLQALPTLAAKEIYRSSLQDCVLRRGSSHSSSPPEIPQRPSPAALGSMRLDGKLAGNSASGDVCDDRDLSSDSDDSMEDMEQNGAHPIYQEIDRNHESKYEPKRSFPPQIKIERKVFQEARLLDSLVSSSNGSQDPLTRLQHVSQSHVSRISNSSSRASVTTNGSGKAEHSLDSPENICEDIEEINSDEGAVSLSLSQNSPRTPATPFYPQAPPTTPSGSLTEVYMDRHRHTDPTGHSFTFASTLPYIKRDHSQPSQLQNTKSSDLHTYSPMNVGGYKREYNSAIPDTSARPVSGHSKPSPPISKSWSYTESNKNLKLKPPVKSPTDVSLSIAEAFTTNDLYKDISVPVYATLKGRAAQIRNSPFSEDSTSDSSDNEDSPIVMTAESKLSTTGSSSKTNITDTKVTVPDPYSTKATTTTLSKKQVIHSSSGAMKRGVSNSSIGSETSSDYALPPDEISCKSDSENSEPELKLLKYTTDSAKRDTLERCGYLSKLGGKVKTWKRRWFVLRELEMSYYKTQHDALRKPQGVITLDHSSRINKSHGELTFEPSSAVSPGNGHSSAELQITNNKRTYYLTADSPQDMEKWIRSINNAIKRQAASYLLDNVDNKTVLKGWLTKVKNGLTRKCFCVLVGRHLLYYKTASDKTPIGQLTLPQSRVEEIDHGSESDEEFEGPATVKRHILCIWPQSHTPTYLIIPTKQEKDSWLYHLTVAAGGGSGNVGTEYEQILSKLMELEGDPGSVFWKHPMILHSKEPITRPLTTLPSENLQTMAVALFKSVRDFMSTMIESQLIDYHVNLAQSMLQSCLDHPQLQNELYCQLIKQTSKHPVQHKTSVQNLLLCGKHSWFLCDNTPTSPTSSLVDLSDSKLNPSPFVVLQGWQLLSMCASLFLPKQSVMWLFRVHLQRSADHRSETGKYAIFCQRSLERSMLKGSREAHPSRMEVLSILLRNPYHHSLPISIPVHFLNGSYQVISFDGSTTVQEFLQTLNKVIGMRECNHSGFSLFTDDPNGTDTEHCLKTTLKVCDVISKWEEAYRLAESGKQDVTRTIRLLYRNRLYFKSTSKGETEKERLLLVYQINKEIINIKFPLNKELALELTSLMAQIEYGDVRLPDDSTVPTGPPPHLLQVLDRFYPQQFRDVTAQDRTLLPKLTERWHSLKGRGATDCVRVYLTVARKWPYCGATLFSVGKKGSREKRIWLAVHEEGLTLLEHSSMQPVTTYDYRSVITFGGFLSDFMFVVNQLTESAPHHYEHHTERLLFVMEKSQILEITHLVASYINFHMLSSPDSGGEM